MLKMPSNPIAMPRSEATIIMQKKSIIQAVNRVTGPASNWEKTIPSGVLISNVLVLLIWQQSGVSSSEVRVGRVLAPGFRHGRGRVSAKITRPCQNRFSANRGSPVGGIAREMTQ